eukprot:m.123600 g.123600  ORF g.123600 m.123600 type:complete len:370 (+) comp22022_c0_seq4:2094-3203(+)
MATTANGDVYEDELTASLLQPSMPDHDVDKPGMVGEPAEAPPHGLGALGAAGFIVSIILGLGVLGIPWAFAQLGWGFGISLLLVSAAGSVYSGFLIDKLAQYVTDHAQEPPRKYADLGEHAFGTRGRVAVRATQYAFLAGVIVAVQLTAAHSLHSVVTVLHGHICPVTANTVIAVIMLPVMQLQKLEEITPVAILGVVLILLPLLLYLTQLPKHTATSDTGVPESSSLADIAAATTTLCFAYQGQTIFPELRSEMADPTTFPRAVVSATVLMTTTYLIVGVVGYMRLGPDAAYLNYWDNEHNPTAGRTVAANIMLILHVMTGFAAHRFSAPAMTCCLHLGGAPSFMLLAHCLRLIRHGGGLLGTLSTGT